MDEFLKEHLYVEFNTFTKMYCIFVSATVKQNVVFFFTLEATKKPPYSCNVLKTLVTPSNCLTTTRTP